MKIISKTGDPKFAEIYVAEMRGNKQALIEFVDAVDPRYPREEKWVIIVSTQIGCPVGCLMCDSGTYFLGNLTKEEIFGQIDFIFSTNSKNKIDHPKLKIQFARMGEPSLNPAVLEVLNELPRRYPVGGLLPCIATTAPEGSEKWFEKLIKIKNDKFPQGKFQLQFSINSTDETERDRVMPVKKWSLEEISKYGSCFYKKGDRKVVLNFALASFADIDVQKMKAVFDPGSFIVKITPVNPTDSAKTNKIGTIISPARPDSADLLMRGLERARFETIISIGSPEEILIGSNCGQSARKILKTYKKSSNIEQLASYKRPSPKSRPYNIF